MLARFRLCVVSPLFWFTFTLLAMWYFQRANLRTGSIDPRADTGTTWSARNNHAIVAIRGDNFNMKSGGVEAMIQLSMAVASVIPGRLFIVTDVDHVGSDSFSPQAPPQVQYHQNYEDEYGSLLPREAIHINALRQKDVYIEPELFSCPTFPQAKYVHMFHYILSDNPIRCMDSRIQSIAHNFYLGKSLPRHRIIQPYIRPSIAAIGDSVYHNPNGTSNLRERIVLIDDDVPHFIFSIVKRAVKELGGKVRILRKVSDVSSVYQTASAIVDWCMRGSERCPLEAVIFGVPVITNNCSSGSAPSRDALVPEHLLFPDQFSSTSPLDVDAARIEEFFKRTIAYAFNGSSAAQLERRKAFEPWRNAILALSNSSMAREAYFFLQELQLIS